MVSERAAARRAQENSNFDFRQAWDGWKRSDSASDEKGYYFDTRGDRNNLAYGSLYRMDVATYRLYDTDWYKAGDADCEQSGARCGFGLESNISSHYCFGYRQDC